MFVLLIMCFKNSCKSKMFVLIATCNTIAISNSSINSSSSMIIHCQIIAPIRSYWGKTH